MTLEQAIHQRWAADMTLAVLVPPEQVTTGRSSRRHVPYVTILRERSRTTVRTNGADTLQEITLFVNVWHADYDVGSTVLDQILAVFDHSSFTLSDSGRVLHMRRIQDSVQQHADGLWQWTIRFLTQIAPAGG